MNIGNYILVKKQIVEELEEENKKKEKRIKDLEQNLKNLKSYVVILENCGKKSTEILRERSKALYDYDLFINCILNKDIRKAIAIYNRTKSIRVKHKNINSISKKIEKNNANNFLVEIGGV
ncbi:TPA: hypothetical protein OLY09_003319 [Clostridioides difficile]|nr:hypothetical protein [Clostridioides difficile]